MFTKLFREILDLGSVAMPTRYLHWWSVSGERRALFAKAVCGVFGGQGKGREGKGRERKGWDGCFIIEVPPSLPLPLPLPLPPAQLADSKLLLDDRSSRRDERAFALGVEKSFCWSL